ncbi:hypothetical protein B296_00011312, partial [Ensete ventricosum]
MQCTPTRAQPEISTGFTSSLATVTVRTPFSMDAFVWSTLAFSSSRNLPLLPSTRYHLSFFFSSLLVPAALAANPENPAFPLILHSRELGHDDGSPGGLLPVDAGGGAEPRDPICQGREDRRHCRGIGSQSVPLCCGLPSVLGVSLLRTFLSNDPPSLRVSIMGYVASSEWLRKVLAVASL